MTDPETTRKHHVWRQRQREDDETFNDEVWIDILRVDQLVTYKRIAGGEDYQKVFYNIKWDDEENPEDHPTRTLTMVEVANPDDEEQIIEVHAISQYKTYRLDQKVIHKFLTGDVFLDGEVETQTVKYRRVYHMDVETDPPCGLEDYERDEETKDEDQYIDVKLIESITTTTGEGESFQRSIHRFNTELIEQFSEPVPAGYDESKVVHLDPFQNIINVRWAGRPLWVASISHAGYDNHMHHSLDGKEWSGRDASGSVGGNIAHGNKKWIVSGGGAGDNSLLSSDDGILWTSLGSSPFPNTFSICFGNGIFVAGGYQELAWSDDLGETWHHVSVLGSDDRPSYVSSLNFIKADPDNPLTVDRFFAGVLQSRTASEETRSWNEMWTSTDGMHWSNIGRLPDFGLDSLMMNGVAYGNGVYVASGGAVFVGEVHNREYICAWVSSNGLGWSAGAQTAAAHGHGSFVGLHNFNNNIAFGAGQFVIVGGDYLSAVASYSNGGKILTSSTGTGWSEVYSAGEYGVMTCVHYGERSKVFVAGGLLGAGDISAHIMWSEDGSSWTTSEIENQNISQVFAVHEGIRRAETEE